MEVLLLFGEKWDFLPQTELERRFAAQLRGLSHSPSSATGCGQMLTESPGERGAGWDPVRPGISRGRT